MKSNTSERKNLIRTADSAPEVALELCLHGQFCLVACRFWVVLILVFFASWRAALGAETDSEIQPARGYSVSGFIEVHDLQQPKDGLFEREWKISRRTEFEVQAGGRFWRVVARYGPEHYEIYTGDGTNIYSYLVQEQTIRDEGFTTYPATVVPGTIPLNSTWYVVLPWLGFVPDESSEGRSESHHVNLPAPWGLPLGDPLALAFHCVVERSTEPPHFVKAAKFFRDVPMLEKLATGEDLTLGGQGVATRERFTMTASKLLAYPEALREAEGEFDAVGWTNVGSFRIPSEFVLKRYFPPQGTNYLGNRQIMSRFRMVVTNAAVSPALLTLSQPDRDLYVIDYRLQNRDLGIRQLPYPVEEGKGWLATNDPAVVALFTVSVQEAAAKVTFSRSVVIGVVAAIVLLPLFLWRRWKRSTRDEPGAAR